MSLALSIIALLVSISTILLSAYTRWGGKKHLADGYQLTLSMNAEASKLVNQWIAARGSADAFSNELLSLYGRWKAGEYMTRTEWEATVAKEAKDA